MSRLKVMAKAVASAVTPGLVAARSNRLCHRAAAARGIPDVDEAMFRACDGRVQAGPFRGMRCLSKAAGSMLSPKLVGSYELELHGFIDLVTSQIYDGVLDVGCAEGYYAVGLALKLPGNPRVTAFDTDPFARHLFRQLARLNGVGVTTKGACRVEHIAGCARKRMLMVSDCEGYELVLLGGDAPEHLAGSDVIVEFHGPYDGVLESFRATHTVDLVEIQARDAALYPALRHLTESQQHLALSELRDRAQTWALLRSKARFVSA